MKIFYFCFAGSHSSVIAANIHLRRLPEDQIPTIEEIVTVNEFDRRSVKDAGIPYFLGQDANGNDVYVIGFGKDREIGLQTIYNLLEQLAVPTTEWKFFDTLSEINWLTKLGGFLSGRLGLVSIGRVLAAKGIQGCYYRLTDVVKKAKEWSNE